MKRLPCPRRRAFTLIELLVTTAIILTVFGASLAGYRRFSQKQILEAAVAEVKNNLRLARSWAMAPRKINCTSLSDYRVSFSSDSYSIYEQCNNGDETEVRSFSLENGVEASGSNEVEFQVLTGESTDSAAITLEKNSFSDSINIVAGSGQIQ